MAPDPQPPSRKMSKREFFEDRHGSGGLKDRQGNVNLPECSFYIWGIFGDENSRIVSDVSLCDRFKQISNGFGFHLNTRFLCQRGHMGC